MQAKLESEEKNAKREEKLLENEFKRKKLQTEMQLEIERQRAATETNTLMAQTEMFERREAEYVARKEKEKQDSLVQKEVEKNELKMFYEQKLALEKKYFDEKERRMKYEAQLREENLRFEKKESIVPVPTSGMSQSTFAKPTAPPKIAVRTATPVPIMTTTSNLANTKLLQPQLGLTNMGLHTPLLTATPRLSTALAYAYHTRHSVTNFAACCLC